MSKKRPSGLNGWNKMVINSLQHLERAGCGDVRELRQQFYLLKGAVLQHHRESWGRKWKFRLKSLNDNKFNGLTFPRNMLQQEIDFLRQLQACLEDCGLKKLTRKVSMVIAMGIDSMEWFEDMDKMLDDLFDLS
ncbi:hypothetical protein [Shimazuella kribbensis]|uniref:hypothetical protein n=1 Tax=Shimazuella kribbensis TaxID=139808 RepID=UPI0012EC9D55|nr:hypothetical protein [Shimazuella kribbensis]